MTRSQVDAIIDRLDAQSAKIDRLQSEIDQMKGGLTVLKGLGALLGVGVGVGSGVGVGDGAGLPTTQVVLLICKKPAPQHESVLRMRNPKMPPAVT